MFKLIDQSIQILQEHFLASLIVYLKMYKFEYRSLTQAEIELAQQVFGDLINYPEVKIFNIPYLPWQPTNIFIAPNGNLFVHPQHFSLDYSQGSRALQGIFIHELAHILQHQQQTNVLLKGAILQLSYYLSFKRYDPYHYRFVQGKAFVDYNIEQQGDIARDIFFKKIPNIILK